MCHQSELILKFSTERALSVLLLVLPGRFRSFSFRKHKKKKFSLPIPVSFLTFSGMQFGNSSCKLPGHLLELSLYYLQTTQSYYHFYLDPNIRIIKIHFSQKMARNHFMKVTLSCLLISKEPLSCLEIQPPRSWALEE